jgi:hypothetical protein
LKLLSLFLITLYEQNKESGQEQVILLAVAGVVTGNDRVRVLVVLGTANNCKGD